MGAIKQANMSYADQEVVLMSKDNTEYKVKFGIAMASETIKALSSFPEEEEDQEDWSVPDAPIPLPPVEGAILAKVIEYCTYHSEHKRRRKTLLRLGTRNSLPLTTTLSSPSSW